MNHVYRLVWDASRHTWVAVSELVRARGKGDGGVVGAVRRGLRALAARGWCLLLLSPTVALALPTGGQVSAGQAGISRSGTTLTVDQGSAKAVIDWQSFGIGSDERVSFHQPGADSVVLNRVRGGNPTDIYGRLDANGQVFLVNPNGVYFAPGSQVNVGGLVASTLDISNQDFLSGNYRFAGDSTAAVTHAGHVTAAAGGYVAFIAHTVHNAGRIDAPQGSVALGAGSEVELQLAGNRLVSYRVSAAALKAQVDNGGVIVADGGRVLMSAQAKDALLATVVNNTGIVQARGVAEHGGTIELLGGDSGTVSVAGTLDASAPHGGDGGTIETSGAHVQVADSAVITTKAASGKSGTWTIDPVDFTVAASGGDMTGAALTAALGNGDVNIQSSGGAAGSNGDIRVEDSVSWSQHTLTLDAYRDIDIDAHLHGSGTAGLALKYGQGAANGVINGTPADYHVRAPVDLASTGSFSTQLGSGGTQVDYTIITTLGDQGSTSGTDLQGIGANAGTLAGKYVLGADIDASPTAAWNDGQGFNPIGGDADPFTGVFDGLMHSISHLKIDLPSSSDVGLFGHAAGAELRRVNLFGVNVSGGANVGGLAGFSESTSVDSVLVDGSVTGEQNVGGLAGKNLTGTLTSSYTTGAVSGGANVGGLIGYNTDHAVIAGGHSAADVSGVGGSSSAIGGLVGANSGSWIGYSYATGAVTGGQYVGGLVGENTSSTVIVSYATGEVSGTDAVGGLLGWNYSTIWDTYAHGAVAGQTRVGGLVGANGPIGGIYTSYASGTVTGNSEVGGLIGSNTSDSYMSYGYWNLTTAPALPGIGGGAQLPATGLTDVQMEQQGSFTGFDFTNTWIIYEGHTEPLLRAFMTPLTVTSANQTRTYDGGTFTLSNAVYSVPGADASGHLFGLTDPYAGARNVGTYDPSGLWSDQQGYIIRYDGGTLTIDPRAVTLSAPRVSKVYDGGTAYTTAAGDLDTLSGALVGGDTVTAATIAYADRNAGNGDKAVTLSGVSIADGNGGANYTVTLAGNSGSTITPKRLTLTGLTADDKIYDATTAATATAGLDGVVTGDTVNDALTASFADKNVGTGKTVTVDGITLSGADAGNYRIGTGQTTTASIFAAPVHPPKPMQPADGVAASNGSGVPQQASVQGQASQMRAPAQGATDPAHASLSVEHDGVAGPADPACQSISEGFDASTATPTVLCTGGGVAFSAG